jgi:hypothetical protein
MPPSFSRLKHRITGWTLYTIRKWSAKRVFSNVNGFLDERYVGSEKGPLFYPSKTLLVYVPFAPGAFRAHRRLHESYSRTTFARRRVGILLENCHINRETLLRVSATSCVRLSECGFWPQGQDSHIPIILFLGTYLAHVRVCQTPEIKRPLKDGFSKPPGARRALDPLRNYS